MARGVGYTKHLDETLLRGVYEQPVQNINFLYRQSSTRDPEFQVGDRVCLPDGRVFRYAKAGSSMSSMKYGVYGYNQLVAEYSSPTCVPTAAIAVGDMSAAFTVTAATIGVSRNGVIAVDELKGGYISFYGTTSGDRPQRGIMGNTALASDGTSITIYWDAPIQTTMNAGVATEILANPYSDVRSDTEQYGIWSSCLGMPNVLAVSGNYYWIQTWGAFRITPTAAALGVNQGERMMVFGANGSICSLPTWHTQIATTPTHSYQIAGFILERTAGGSEDAAPFINLMINP